MNIIYQTKDKQAIQKTKEAPKAGQEIIHKTEKDPPVADHLSGRCGHQQDAKEKRSVQKEQTQTNQNIKLVISMRKTPFCMQ